MNAGESIEVARGASRSPRQKEQVLNARAQLLAREPLAPSAAAEQLVVVEFVLATERYALESTRIREVYPLREYAALPCTPPFILGIVNVRGQIITVMDVRWFFELPFQGVTHLSNVLIIEAGLHSVGILADSVLGLRAIPRDRIRRALPTLGGSRADYLVGITDDRTAILDPGKILSDPKVVVREDVEG
jgi:purine-binding chemotaxis protein CheW